MFSIACVDNCNTHDLCLTRIVWGDAVGTTVHLRLCQFHIVQAILRYFNDVASKKGDDSSIDTTDGNPIRFRLVKEAREKVLVYFRALQRCRDPEEWDDAVEEFQSNVREACQDLNVTDARIVILLAYFDLNWLCDEWRGAFYTYLSFYSTMQI